MINYPHLYMYCLLTGSSPCSLQHLMAVRPLAPAPITATLLLPILNLLLILCPMLQSPPEERLQLLVDSLQIVQKTTGTSSSVPDLSYFFCRHEAMHAHVQVNSRALDGRGGFDIRDLTRLVSTWMCVSTIKKHF